MLSSTTIQTRFGRIGIIADDRGLIEVVLPGSSPKTASEPSGENDPHAILAQAAEQIREFLAGERTVFSLPLSIQGTSFQVQVWEIIRSIPYGRTMSYGEIGKRLGSGNKARAVGGAAHANPLPLIIPCHRVIGAGGSLTGFAGGLPLKEKLLAMERTQAAS